MDRAELERRTKDFALRMVRFVAALPRNKVSDVAGRLDEASQLVAMFTAANRTAKTRK